jgi:hypothetical protein
MGKPSFKRQPQKTGTVKFLADGYYEISGGIEVAAGSLNLSLSINKTDSTPPGTEPPTDIPPGAIIIEPSGGDDTQRLRDAVSSLPEGGTLMLKGMFRVSDTIKLEGGRYRTVCGYPNVRSGILVENADMPGAYGSMLQLVDAIGSTMRDLEIDVQGRSTQPMIVERGEDNTVARLYVHDVGYQDTSDPTLAAIHSEKSTRLHIVGNRIERTGGRIDVDSGIRGIWMGKGHTDLLVEDNDVSDTGHTCIAVEPCSGVVRRNKAYNSLTQGSLYKITGHPEAATLDRVEFYDNYGQNAKNTGLMTEAAAFQSIDVHHNHFKDCGAQGTTFGAFYCSQWTTTNLHFHDNIIENCRSVGGMLRSQGCKIENNQIIGGDNTLWLESDDTDITVNNSGRVNVGANCSNIWVDGQQVA